MVRKIVGLVLVGLTAAVLAACAAPSSNRQVPAADVVSSTSAPSPSSTFSDPAHVTFEPFAPDGTRIAPVHGSRTGSCFTSSIATPLAGAYRCLAGNELLDPCFARPGGKATTVSCFADPWSAGVNVRLTKPLPKTEPLVRDGLAWALELANSERCLVMTGALPLVDNRPVNYRCGDSAVASLEEGPDGQIRVWYGSADGPLHPVAVESDWRARTYAV